MAEGSQYKLMTSRNPFPKAIILEEWESYEEFPEITEPGSLLTPTLKFVDEHKLIRMMQTIKAKPSWEQKVKDETIASKWKSEGIESGMREELVTYAIDELKWTADLMSTTKGAVRWAIDGTWHSDSAISSELRNELIDKVKALEDIPEEEKDFHPGSNDRVLDIVHPSLYCLVFKVSKDTKGTIIEPLEEKHEYRESASRLEGLSAPEYSDNYQWLPAEFLVDETNNVKIASYINGLRVESGLYSTIAAIFSKAVPLLDRVLTDLFHFRLKHRLPWPNGFYWWDEEGVHEPPDSITNDEYDEWRDARVPLPVPVPAFDPKEWEVSGEDKITVSNHRLQVIVKIASMQLDPEHQEYNGGNWHIEGMANERIVATVIYYFDTENIVDDRLEFRRAAHLDAMRLEQGDSKGVREMFNMTYDAPMVENSGSVETKAGRLLVFPNVYQHRSSSFKLADRTKPGHRKLLVFFVVDPTERIISTAHVPPQDQRWFDLDMEHFREDMNKLPTELIERIRNAYGGLSLEEAKKHRLKLMEERSVTTDAYNEEVMARECNFCEH